MCLRPSAQCEDASPFYGTGTMAFVEQRDVWGRLNRSPGAFTFTATAADVSLNGPYTGCLAHESTRYRQLICIISSATNCTAYNLRLENLYLGNSQFSTFAICKSALCDVTKGHPGPTDVSDAPYWTTWQLLLGLLPLMWPVQTIVLLIAASLTGRDSKICWSDVTDTIPTAVDFQSFASRWLSQVNIPSLKSCTWYHQKNQNASKMGNNPNALFF